jgi:hypothetical protein
MSQACSLVDHAHGGRQGSSVPSGFLTVTGGSVSTPPLLEKSMWKYVRRNSPSVTDCKPMSLHPDDVSDRAVLRHAAPA